MRTALRFIIVLALCLAPLSTAFTAEKTLASKRLVRALDDEVSGEIA